jgi:glycolate oxidase iron-sulfur subunit
VKPDVILTANIGCQLHLQQATEIPVKHWIEILEEEIQS